MIFCFFFSVIVIIGGEKEVRAMMLIAHSKKMTLSGEYAFIYTELIEGEGSQTFLLFIFSAIIYFFLAIGNMSWSGGSGIVISYLYCYTKKS